MKTSIFRDKDNERLMATVDLVLTNVADKEMRGYLPGSEVENIAFERNMVQAEILKGLADELGRDARIYADSIGVEMLPEREWDAEMQERKADLDRNRKNASDNLLAGKSDIYSNAKTLRHLTVVSSDGKKAVTLSYQRVNAGTVITGLGNTTTGVEKTVYSGEACEKLKNYLAKQSEAPYAELGQVVDAVAEKKITAAGQPAFSPSMTNTEFESAIKKANDTLTQAKTRLLPCVSEETRTRLEDSSHPANQSMTKWVLSEGQAVQVSKLSGLHQHIDKIRGVAPVEQNQAGQSGSSMQRPTPKLSPDRETVRVGFER